MKTPRRNFIRTVLIGGAGAMVPGIPLRRVFAEPPAPRSTRVDWRRVVFAPAHALRDGGSFTIPSPSEQRDIVIVGAGATSLSAAYHLRDADFVMLEKEPQAGGNAYRELWNGISYTTGTAYTGPPSTPLGRFFEGELGLKLLPIQSHDSYIVGGKTVWKLFPDGIDQLPFSESVRQGFHRFYRRLRDLAPTLAPQVEKGKGCLLESLDRLSLSEWIRRERFPQEVHDFASLYCTPQVGGYPEDLSAAHACSVMGESMGSYEENYTFPGGLGAASEVMRDRVQASGKDRLRLNAFVVRVAGVEDGRRVDVTYLDGDAPRTVRCRVCLWAAPKHIARYVIQGMPEEQRLAIGRMGFHNISVMNLCYRRTIFDGAYQAWFQGLPVVDLLPADWVLVHGKADPGRPQILSCDWPQRQGDRALLLDDPWVVEQCQQTALGFEKMFPGSLDHLEEIRVYVRAHSWVIATPGYITRLRPIISRPVGRVLIARSDQMYFELAYESGVEMAQEARRLLAA